MIYKSSNAYSFGTAKKDTGANLIKKEITKIPIGNYTKEIIEKPKGGMQFSKEERLKPIKPTTPGPGQYDVKTSHFGDGGPKYTIKKSKKETEISSMANNSKKLPGPGDYVITEENYEKTKYKKVKVNKFGKSPKLRYQDNKVPGVCKYNPESLYNFGKGQKNKFTIGKAERSNIVDLSKTSSSFRHKGDIKALDPGYYDVRTSTTFGKEGPKISIRGKPKDSKRFETPGPSNYDSVRAKNYTLKNNPAASLGYGNKSDIVAREKKKNVPDCNYNYNGFDVSDKSKIKCNTFGKAERMPKEKVNAPGPGSYHIPCSFANTPDYSRIGNDFSKI